MFAVNILMYHNSLELGQLTAKNFIPKMPGMFHSTRKSLSKEKMEMIVRAAARDAPEFTKQSRQFLISEIP